IDRHRIIVAPVVPMRNQFEKVRCDGGNRERRLEEREGDDTLGGEQTFSLHLYPRKAPPHSRERAAGVSVAPAGDERETTPQVAEILRWPVAEAAAQRR